VWDGGRVTREPDAFENPQFARAYVRVSQRAERRGVAEHRRRLLGGLRGVVCEVGAGNGLNFAQYPGTVTRVIAVEPEPTLRGYAEEAARRAPVPVTVLAGHADALPVEDGSCDAVVASLVLCTVPDPATSLAEAWRVLRPGGELAFYEHVRSANRVVAALEDLAAPVWSRMAGGCHPNRDAVAEVRAAGFEVTSVDRFGFSSAPGLPRIAHTIGHAVRA
jgi:SAM-dependent methyltransferase